MSTRAGLTDYIGFAIDSFVIVMSCITLLQCHQVSTANVHYCKQPHLTVDELENGVEWPYTTSAITRSKVSFVITLDLQVRKER